MPPERPIFKIKTVKGKEVKRMTPSSQMFELKRRLAGMTGEQIRQLIKTKSTLAIDLLALLLNARRLKSRNITADDLNRLSYTGAGLSYTGADLKQLGYGAIDLKQLGYGVAELIKAGFSQQEVNKAIARLQNKK